MATADPAANSLDPDRQRSKPVHALSDRRHETGPAHPRDGERGRDTARTERAVGRLRPAGGCAPDTGVPPRMSACQTCLARHRGICAVLTDEQLKELGGRVARRRIPAGSVLQANGEEPVVCANLLHGVVKLAKTLADGRQQIVGLQFPPEFVGQPFGSESRLSAEAVTDVEVCSIPRTVLESVMTSHPALERRLFCDTLLQLDQARDWLLAIGRKTARERVAGLLHLIASQFCRSASGEGAVTGEQTFDMPLSRAEMADFLGLTIETVSRQITRLRQAGVISLGNNRQITIHAMEQLLDLAED